MKISLSVSSQVTRGNKGAIEINAIFVLKNTKELQQMQRCYVKFNFTILCHEQGQLSNAFRVFLSWQDACSARERGLEMVFTVRCSPVKLNIHKTCSSLLGTAKNSTGSCRVSTVLTSTMPYYAN